VVIRSTRLQIAGPAQGEAGGTKAAGDKGMTTGKLFRAQEHADRTISYVFIREIEGIDFGRLREKTLAKFITR